MSKSKPLKGKITISRPTFGDGRELIQIEIEDVDARQKFLLGYMDPHDFAMCLTGLSSTPIELTPRNLDKVGLKRETDNFVVPEPDYWPSYQTPTEEHWDQLVDPYEQDGWKVHRYLGSQNSKFIEDGVRKFRLTRYRWVEKTDAN